MVGRGRSVRLRLVVGFVGCAGLAVTEAGPGISGEPPPVELCDTGDRAATTPLMRAAFAAEAVSVPSGQPVTQEPERNPTSDEPLVLAVWSGDETRITDALDDDLEALGRCDASGITPLGRPSIVEALLRAGADPHPCGGKSPPVDAVMDPIVEVALAEARTDPGPGKAVVIRGELPDLGVRYGSEADRERRLRALDLLFDHGADPNRDPDGRAPPLLTAIMTGDRRFVELLVARGADPGRLSWVERMALRLAGRGELLKAASAARR